MLIDNDLKSLIVHEETVPDKIVSRLSLHKSSYAKNMFDQLDKFNHPLDDLDNIEVKLEDEDKILHLLNAFSSSYENMRDAMTTRERINYYSRRGLLGTENQGGSKSDKY